MTRKRIPSRARRPTADASIALFKQALRFTPSIESAISRLKASLKPIDLFRAFPTLFDKNKILDRFHGTPFPATYEDLYSKKVEYEPADATTEVMWAICRCLQFTEEIRQFNELREAAERAFISNQQTQCEKILTEVRTNFGVSTWLIQTQMSMGQLWYGIENTREISIGISTIPKIDPILTILVSFIGKRIEASGVKDYLKNELHQLLDGWNNQNLEKYLRAKLFEAWDLNTESVPAFLTYEGRSSLIDYYESLISVLQAAASDRTIYGDVSAALEPGIQSLFIKTNDNRLPPIMRGIGILPELPNAIDSKRATLIEKYSQGLYRETVELAELYLIDEPVDLPILILQTKACVAASLPIPQRTGVLEILPESFGQIFRTSSEIYAGAYALFQLAERFYGQSWVSYLHAALAYELREEQAEYPPLWFRDMYVRDPHLSPFSVVACEPRLRNKVLASSEIDVQFPNTLAIYRAVVEGFQDHTPSPRTSRYLGQYFLAKGSSSEAIEHLSRATGSGSESDQIRTAGLVALAYLQLNAFDEALTTICNAYFANEHAPALLPLSQCIERLGSPTQWPNHIGVPILLSLYATNVRRDQLPKLFYSFERFQTTNNIQKPSDLMTMVSKDNLKMAVFYLNELWRPDVMRQTILYAGTKQIEDERVAVCRFLTEIDPENAGNYLDEIKDRVKRQQISQSSKLIEQSKVYVDIESIRASLRSKIGDSYKRYKASMQPKQDQLVFEVVEQLKEKFSDTKLSVPNLLSRAVLLNSNPPVTEADVQFAAIFSEVTNEFLKGEHGLNAYLSTRVRHGKLSNTLRKAVTDEHLVTARTQDGLGYVENTHWADLYPNTEPTVNEGVRIALLSFTSDFDRIIDYVKDHLIQIKIANDYKDDSTSALFVYRTSILERRYVQQFDHSFKNIDDLVGYCVGLLWEKTDNNLEEVKHALNGDIKDQLLANFDRLSDEIRKVDSNKEMSELVNSIARARTDSQHRLAQIVGWFQRNEVYDRADCSADFPAQVALNMIKQTISDASHWDRVKILCNPGAPALPGKSLDTLVDVYYDLLDNAIGRAGLDSERLNLSVEISFDGSHYKAEVMNDVHKSKVNDISIAKLAALRDVLQTEERKKAAQREGKSGFSKIWTHLNAVDFKNCHLSFDFVPENKFKVVFAVDLKAQNP